MSNHRFFFLVALIATQWCWGQAPSDKTRTNTTQLMRALPGVYRIEVSGEGKMQIPKLVRVKWRELKDAAIASKASSETGRNLSSSFHLWNALEKNPEKYIELSDKRVAIPLYGGSGSGFAISRDGILLTNRHVVGEFSDAPLNVGDLARSANEHVAELFDEICNHIDYQESDRFAMKQSLGSVATWYASQGRKTFRVNTVAVVVAYTHANVEKQSTDASVIAAKVFDIKTDLASPIVLPASMVGVGGPDLAQDIAILKIDVDVQDALICLPLADSQVGKENDEIFSLGFPGFRYDEKAMSLRQMCEVNVEPGRIESLPIPGKAHFRELARLHPKGLMLSDRSMLAVSALIRPGSSGGPVILADGTVIGLNVAYRDLPVDERNNIPFLGDANQQWLSRELMQPHAEQPSSVNLTVPVDAAKRLLEKHNIKPDIGETTRAWLAGLKSFEEGDLRAAKAKFQQVAAAQKARLIEKPTDRVTRPISISSHYVMEMIKRCEKSEK